MRPTSRSIAQRLRLISLSITFLCAFIGLALAYFQVYKAEAFERTSKKNFLRYETVDSLRGAILDRTGIPLATNRPVARLVWKGSGNKRFTPEQKETIKELEETGTLKLIENPEFAKAERRGETYTLIEDLSFERLSIIVERFPANQNLIISTTSARYYPHKTLASHIVGYFRDTAHQKTGTLGLEKLFEEQLRGQPGARENMVNSVGRRLASRDINQAQAGKPLQTTLDFDLQMIAETVFPADEIGAFIVMDPESGDLLAMVSRPTFDPNMFTGSITPQVWDQCKQERPFVNRALSNYPPASLFKLVTMTAGLEEGIITEQSRWFCSGQINYGGRPWHCHKKEGHGTLSPEEALAHSCNIPCFEIGKRISVDTLARYAHKLGLGEPTGSIFPERTGLIPTVAWKRKQYHQPWAGGETLMVAIGQTFCLVTPLQMARMIGSIATGQLVRPRILLQEPIARTPSMITPKTRDFLIRALHKMVMHGTGSVLRRFTQNGFDLYGKSGTAQVTTLEKSKGGEKQFLPHGWFIGYSKYKEERPIVLVAIVEHIGSSSIVVGGIIKDFLSGYAKLMDKRRNPVVATDTTQDIPSKDMPLPETLTQDLNTQLNGETTAAPVTTTDSEETLERRIVDPLELHQGAAMDPVSGLSRPQVLQGNHSSCMPGALSGVASA